MKLPSITLAVVATLALLTLPSRTKAADYPSKQVTILVPYAPGGITDVLGRIVAHQLTAHLHQPFIVENKPGGGTIVAMLALERASPDGYTLMMAPNGTLAINPTLYKSLPYSLKDIKPIALVGALPFALVVSPKFPVKTVQDVIKLAKEKPNQINYGSGGVGTNGAVFMKLFESEAGIKMVHVPYRGSAPQLTATMAGQVSLGFVDANSASGLVKSGKLRALAVTSSTRFPGLPDVPTMEEAGVKGFNTDSWQMLITPAATPKAIAELLNSKINAIIQSSSVKEKIVKLGVNPGGRKNIGELEKFMKSEAARWGAVIRNAGLAGTL